MNPALVAWLVISGTFTLGYFFHNHEPVVMLLFGVIYGGIIMIGEWRIWR